MLKLFRNLLSGLSAALAIQPVSRAAITHQEQVSTDLERQINAVEYEHAFTGVRPESLANYKGTKTEITPELLAMVRSSKRFRNTIIDPIGAQMEVQKFVEERTR